MPYLRLDSLASEWTSNKVLFPVPICSPVLPLPNCPCSPLPNEKTSQGRSLARDKEDERLDRTFSALGQQDGEADTRGGLHDRLLAAHPRALDQGECMDLRRHRVSTLHLTFSRRAPCTKDTWGSLPGHSCSPPHSKHLRCCPQAASAPSHMQHAQTSSRAARPALAPSTGSEHPPTRSPAARRARRARCGRTTMPRPRRRAQCSGSRCMRRAAT